MNMVVSNVGEMKLQQYSTSQQYYFMVHFVQVQLGNDFACALDDVGEVTCWGTEGKDPPVGPFVQLTGQYYFMCGLDEDYTGLC